VPVQLVRIRTDSPILTKRQPFLKAARFPVTFQFDIGPCIEPGTFQTVRQLNAYVENWYRASLPDPDPLKRPFLPADFSLVVTADGIRAAFRVPADPFYCHGHMPGNPLVPGYAQMAWAHEIIEAAAGPLQQIGFFRWKFLQPVVPGDHMEIVIGPPAARRDVAILRGGGRVTQGKLITESAGGAA
jgi:3-hydroxymyristoyl/3-hydroxydecanoyl-(acyl carrier protein) dehydratase